MTDAAGNEIKPGCLILYPSVKHINTPSLRWGRVERVKPFTRKDRNTGKITEAIGGVVYTKWIEWYAGVRAPKVYDGRLDVNISYNVIVVPWSNPIPDNVRQLLDPKGEFTVTGVVG